MSDNTNTPSTEKKKPNKVVLAILALVVIGGVIFGISKWIYASGHEDTDDAQIDGDISPVVARVGGYVDSILFQENERVKNNALLVKLDKHDYQVRLEQAKAGQVQAGASVLVTESGISSTEANAASAYANVVNAKVKLDQVNKDYDRYANLVKDGSITQQAFDQAKAQKESAAAQLKAAQDQYKAASDQVKTSRKQVAVSSSSADQRKAEVDFAQLQLSYTDIKSPTDGIVSKKNIQKGQLIQAGQTLFSVVNDKSLYVTANFKETQLGKLKPGQKVEIVVDAFEDYPIEGEVLNFSPATGARFSLLPPDNATGNFVKVVQRVPVKIRFTKVPKEVEGRIRPGMSVNVSVDIKNS
ncbi:MAG: HlyD family secretion protein [Mucilaginibacter polytrichastri]|nr:HlyD family secretion protein [Mucilaginibacter polytrichastri]